MLSSVKDWQVRVRKPTDWYKLINLDGSVSYEWFEGSFDIEGYEHVGYNLTTSSRDINNNRTTIKYDGATKSSYLYNSEKGVFEFLKNYNNTSAVTSFLSKYINGPITTLAQMSGAVVNGSQGVVIILYEGIVNGRDFGGYNAASLGYQPILDITRTLNYNNGKWVHINFHSRGNGALFVEYGKSFQSTTSLINLPSNFSKYWEWIKNKFN